MRTVLEMLQALYAQEAAKPRSEHRDGVLCGLHIAIMHLQLLREDFRKLAAPKAENHLKEVLPQ